MYRVICLALSSLKQADALHRANQKVQSIKELIFRNVPFGLKNLLNGLWALLLNGIVLEVLFLRKR